MLVLVLGYVLAQTSPELIFHIINTGCDGHFWNPVVFNILKEPLHIQKQTLHQQKALNLRFKMAPWKWVWHYQRGMMMTCRKRTFLPTHTYAFRGKQAWRLSDDTTPSFWMSNKRWDQWLSSMVLFVSVLLIVLLEYWKRLDKNFQKWLFLRFPKKDEIYKK